MMPLTLSSTIVHGGRTFVVNARRRTSERRNYVIVTEGSTTKRYWFQFSRRRPFTVALLKRAIDRFIQDGAES